MSGPGLPRVLAGLTLAALGIPGVLGYTKIAGMPLVTGLYTMLLPMAVYAVLGSSRHLVVAADSATAVILAAALTGLAAVGSERYVRLAGLAALLTAGMLLAARLARLSFLANFLYHYRAGGVPDRSGHPGGGLAACRHARGHRRAGKPCPSSWTPSARSRT